MKPSTRLVLALAVATQLGLSIDAMRGNSATYDEGAHLPAGFTHLVLGDHRLNPEQPPLVKLLAAVPVALAGARMRADDVAWREARQWEFGRRFLYRWNDGRRLLLLGRLPMALLASCLVAFVFLEARSRHGPFAGAAAAVLAALSPEVLAHGTLVTTDLAFALFFFVSVASSLRLLEEATPTRLLAAGLAAGGAFASKFSAPILLPLLTLLAALAALGPTPLRYRIGRRSGELAGRTARLAAAGALLAAVFALAVVVVWASYGFRYALSTNAEARRAAQAAQQASGAASALVAAVGRAGLLPEDYVRGFQFVMKHSESRPAFLMGQISERGFPHYFLMTFLFKTPLPLVLLAFAALPRLRQRGRADAFWWLALAVYAAFTASRGLQIGHRHLLPVYPFLFVLAGAAAAELARWRRPLGGLLVAALGVWYGFGTLRTHPHHLAYFNEIAGGPANGWRLLVDSNIDWGQDLGRLEWWLRAHGETRVKLSYFGSADPASYGIRGPALPGVSSPRAADITRTIEPGDLLAVSVTNLQGVYFEPEDQALMARIRSFPLVGRAGWSIRIYRADAAWPAPAADPGASTSPAAQAEAKP